MSHHYMSQPRDWHGRWCAGAGCGAVNPRAAGLPQRCYRSETYGDPVEYMNHLENILSGNTSCSDIEQYSQDVNDDIMSAIDTANELDDIADAISEPTTVEIGVAIIGAALAASLISALPLAGAALFGELGAAAGVTAAWAALMSESFTVEFLAALSGGALGPAPPINIPPEELAEAFTPAFQEVLDTLHEGGDVMETIHAQFEQMSIPGIPPDALLTAYSRSWQSFFATRARHLEGVRTSLGKLHEDCRILEASPDYEVNLRRRLQKMRTRYQKECRGA